MCMTDVSVHGTHSAIKNRIGHKSLTAEGNEQGQRKEEEHKADFISNNAPRRSGRQRHLRTITQSKQYLLPMLLFTETLVISLLSLY
jgi:hypothetical protein